MKFCWKLLSGAALALALSNTASANTYNLVDTLDTNTFNFTLTTAGDASSSYQVVTAISGVVNGLNITGLIDTSVTNFFQGDNMFKFSPADIDQSFHFAGLGFTTEDGQQWLLYSTPPLHFWYKTGYQPNTTVTDTTSATPTPVAATAVPEPEAYAMMLAGLGLVGFAARRKQSV